VFEQPTLNDFAALGQEVHKEVRTYIQEVFSETTKFPEILRDNEGLREEALLVKEDTKNHLPMQIGDYSDFFAGRNHAYNLGYFSPFLFALSLQIK
jgi:fumarylacetoacetase